MNTIILQTLPADAGFDSLMALGLAFFIAYIIFVIAAYIFTSFAFASIARKVKYPNPGYAWIPIVGPALIASSTAKMPWWPILLLIGAVIPVIGGLFGLAFTVFFIIWMWKTFEKLGRPGWWAILLIIPIVNFVMLGIAAWSNNK